MPTLKRMVLDRFAEVSYRRWQSDGAPAVVALDTETEGGDFFDRPFCLTVTWERPDGTLRNGYFETTMNGPEYERSEQLAKSLLFQTSTWMFHNAKFDLQKFLLENWVERADLDTKVIHDTEAIWHLLDNVDRKGLKYLAGKHIGEENREPEKKLAKVRRRLGIKKDDGYFFLPREYVVPYAMKDTELTYRLWQLGLPKVMAQPKLAELYQMELELTLVMLDMEAAGLGIDVDYVNEQASKYGSMVISTLAAIRHLTGKDDFNPASVPQLKAAFADRGLTLESTDEDHLLPLDDDLAKTVLQYRQLTKMHKTYFVALQREHKDGIVHPSFRQHGARTGRMSSGKAEQ